MCVLLSGFQIGTGHELYYRNNSVQIQIYQVRNPARKKRKKKKDNSVCGRGASQEFGIFNHEL